MPATIAAGAVLLLALTGCTATRADSAEEAAEVQAENAKLFAACLRAEEVMAQVGGGEYVVVNRGAEPLDDDRPSGELVLSDDPTTGLLASLIDRDGVLWIAGRDAAAFADDPPIHDAYAACEAQHPEFAQPGGSVTGDLEEQRRGEEELAAGREAALAFAGCAREAGFVWVADPSAELGETIELPADLTEPEFLALLRTCWGPETQLTFQPAGDELGFDWYAALEEFRNGSEADR